jgi:hypothetical protein
MSYYRAVLLKMKKSTFFTIGLAWLVASTAIVSAQTRTTKIEDGKSVKTARDLENRRRQILEGMELAMGPLPDRSKMTPPDVQILETIQGDGFIRLAIPYGAGDDQHVPAYLRLPIHRPDGWSPDNPDNARLFAQGEHCTAIQQDLNVFGGSSETLRVCEELGLARINKGPLAQGLLTGKFTPQTSFPEDDVRPAWNLKEGPRAEQLQKLEAVRDILTSNGRTLVQRAICWLWARSPSTIPIPGFKTVRQVEENLGALAFDPLAPEQVQEIDHILGRE